MPPPKANLPPPAEPRYSRNFDPWNCVGTGHQRAETRGPQGWRESRNLKMSSQFRAGNSGGERVSDTVGVGSEDFDERIGMLVPKDVRVRAKKSVVGMLHNPGIMKPKPASRQPFPSAASASASSSPSLTMSRPGLPQEKGVSGAPVEEIGGDDPRGLTAEENLAQTRKAEDEERDEERKRRSEERKIFDGLIIYVNGSTHPLVSDHRLKHLLSGNGARVSLHLGRRQVTHVILGKPSTGPGGGAGGGLASGKLEKEIRRVGGCGVKFVGVEWVLESIKAGKRLPEARFANLKIAARRQQSVLGAFSKTDGNTQQPAAVPPRN
ncbi:uncharacterized protein C8A04DRAFT_36864 [Dichotomopilus funicola]|uniref:BRCT domain-containing protein n=1 Tax=Dichotomopilus funicola TaxID=1934379 RepID=A0AAN6ZM07_9PEZI|nr:hypothetical protein C8A04DRAFT_36864 [Dichotomopilus funicola]